MKILVAVDGSKPSLNAVKYAVKLASGLRTNDHITLINVHDDQGLRHAQHFVGKDQVQDYLRELSDKELKSALAVLVKAGVKHDSIIQTGHVAEIISNVADKKFDMVVMGTKGRAGVVDLLVGSVAQRVLATCKKPVLLVK
ncbi:universal stress protein [Limnohabitans sp. TS-CS-82]|jgi:nucleotide-binding universal stress UspA family protein|uniref:universal stress protein n=1 Tax=Limnohabitans sp. TS-CS-82 TaxID=2094193 RepID=UPI000CF21A15|nr:universal stress protein [Limnohabitans sp. TS-CS-82]PQA83231.1 universal stress protein [Limnohabitans sp. TS-CS-82]